MVPLLLVAFGAGGLAWLAALAAMTAALSAMVELIVGFVNAILYFAVVAVVMFLLLTAIITAVCCHQCRRRNSRESNDAARSNDDDGQHTVPPGAQDEQEKEEPSERSEYVPPLLSTLKVMQPPPPPSQESKKSSFPGPTAPPLSYLQPEGSKETSSRFPPPENPFYVVDPDATTTTNKNLVSGFGHFAFVMVMSVCAVACAVPMYLDTAAPEPRYRPLVRAENVHSGHNSGYVLQEVSWTEYFQSYYDSFWISAESFDDWVWQTYVDEYDTILLGVHSFLE